MHKVIAAAATVAACLAAGLSRCRDPGRARQVPGRKHHGLRQLPHAGGAGRTDPGQGAVRRTADRGRQAFTAVPSNITPDPETGIGKWTDAQIKTAIRQGKRPPNAQNGGTLIGPPMPFGQYRGIADADIDAVVAYLRTVPAVKNAVAKSTYHIPLPPAWGPPIDKPITAPPASDKVAYGAYLAGPLGHCVECHTPMGPDHRQQFATLLGAGGMQFNRPWG